MVHVHEDPYIKYIGTWYSTVLYTVVRSPRVQVRNQKRKTIESVELAILPMVFSYSQSGLGSSTTLA